MINIEIWIAGLILGLLIGGSLGFILGWIRRFDNENNEDREQEAITIIIDWLLIKITSDDINRHIKVEMMGVEYPFEPDIYTFPSMVDAMCFIRNKVIELDVQP